jgi:predicted nucleotidyltransferase
VKKLALKDIKVIIKNMDEKIYSILEKIFKETKPISIFLYGSRARTDFKIDSDYEIGIIYDGNKVSRSELKEKHNLESLVLYPFELKSLKNNDLDTPFPKAIYLKELIETGKTILGEKILENMVSPKIMTIDLIERISFDIATAFAAVRSFRNNDLISTSINFKSALFGARVLEIFKLGKFPYTYDEIFELSEKLNLDDEYRNLLKAAMNARNKGEIKEKYLFKNISFLNQVIMKEIKDDYYKNGDRIIL